MNILFIAVDTLKADHMGCYGYGKDTTPNIDMLASKGVRFSECFSHTNCTQPGFTTMFSGMYSITHDIISHDIVTRGKGYVEINRDVHLFPEILKKHGYKTLAADNLASMRPWFKRGYDEYVYTTPDGKPECMADAKDVSDIAVRLLEKHKGEKFFLFVHFWDPHQPYEPPEEFDRFYHGGNPKNPGNHELDLWRRSLFGGSLFPGITDPEYIISKYDGEIAYADEHVGQVLKALDKWGLREDTLIVLTSDHGEIMNEPNCTLLGHAVRFCHMDLYDNVLRIPLIIFHPMLPENKVFDQFVQHVDIAPTLLDIIGVRNDTGMEGIDLLPLIKGKTNTTRDWVEISEHTYQPRRGIRTKEWKFIKVVKDSESIKYGRPKKEIYNLVNDPQELMNIVDARDDMAKELEGNIDNWVSSQLKKWNKPDPFEVQELSVMGLKSIENIKKSRVDYIVQ